MRFSRICICYDKAIGSFYSSLSLFTPIILGKNSKPQCERRRQNDHTNYLIINTVGCTVSYIRIRRYTDGCLAGTIGTIGISVDDVVGHHHAEEIVRT